MAGTPLPAISFEDARPRPLHDDVPVSSNGNGSNGNGRPAKLPMIGGQLVDPDEIAAQVEDLTAPEAIAWAIERFHPALRFATSFQKTSSVIIDIAHRIETGAQFFYLDTGLLFDET